MLVQLELQSGNFIKWEYIDTSFANKHKELLKEAVEEGFEWFSSWGSLPHLTKEWDEVEIESLLKELRHCIEKINKISDAYRGTSINHPVKIDEIYFEKHEHLKNQHLLNRVHRAFTTFNQSHGDMFAPIIKDCYIRDHNNSKIVWASWDIANYDMYQYMDDPSFIKTAHSSDLVNVKKTNCLDKFLGELDNGLYSKIVFINEDDITYLRDLTEKTNILVHKLEHFCLNPNKIKMKEECHYKEYMLECLAKKAYYFTPNDKKCMAYEAGADVWFVQHEILGKNYPTGFLDHDDPTNWDIWEGIKFTASFGLGDRSYCNWKPFRDWMKNHNLTGIPLGYPIGKIIEGTEYLESLDINSVKNITYYE